MNIIQEEITKKNEALVKTSSVELVLVNGVLHFKEDDRYLCELCGEKHSPQEDCS